MDRRPEEEQTRVMRWRQDLPALAFFLFLLPAILIGEATLPGRALVPLDIVTTLKPWEEAPEYRDHEAVNRLLSDQAVRLYPWARLARDRVRDGEMPLWNPHQRAGRPFLANPQTGVLAPTTAARYIVPLEKAPMITAWIQLFLAGFGTYLLLRFLNASRIGGVVSGIFFALASFNISWMGHPPTRVSCWLPLLVLASLLLLRRPSLRHVALLALLLALQFLGGHPETSFQASFFLVLTFLIVLVSRVSRDGFAGFARRLVAFGGAGITGLLLSAILLLPFLEYLLASDALAHRSDGWTNAGLPFINLLTLLVPDVFGNPARGGYMAHWTNYCEGTFYIGIVCLLLAPLGLFMRATRKIAALCLTLCFVAVGVAYHIPGISDLFLALPGFDVGVNDRLILIAEMGLAVAAGLGVTFLIRESGSAAAIWLTLGLISAFSFFVYSGFDLFFNTKDFYAVRVEVTPELHELVTRGVIVAATLAVATLVLVALRSLNRMGKGVFSCLIILLALGDMVIYSHGFNPVLEESFPEHEAVEWLESQPRGRVLPIANNFPPEIFTYYGLDDLDGRDFMEPRWMMDLLRGTEVFHPQRYSLVREPSAVVNMLNVRYVIAPIPMSVLNFRLVRPYAPLGLGDNRDRPRPFRSIELWTALFDAENAKQGETVAVLELHDEKGEMTTYPLRAGIETASWTDSLEGRPNQHETLDAAFTRELPESFPVEGKAKIFACRFEFPQDVNYRQAALRLTHPTGGLAVFSLITDPPYWAGGGGKFTPVEDVGVVMHVNPDVLPRAFLAATAEVATGEGLHQRLMADDFDPQAVAFVESEDATGHLHGGFLPSPDSAKIVEDLPERVVVEVDAEGDSMLVLADTWFPGWKAYLDAEGAATVMESGVLRVNGALRGVLVPKGISRVSFIYEPEMYRLGGILSALGLLTLLLLFFMRPRKGSVAS